MRFLFIYPDYKVNIDPQTGRMTGVDEGGWYMEGVASLAAVLKHAGHEVDLFHLTNPVGREEFRDTLRAHRPDLMGFVTMTREYPQVKEYVLWAKDALDVSWRRPPEDESKYPTPASEQGTVLSRPDAALTSSL